MNFSESASAPNNFTDSILPVSLDHVSREQFEAYIFPNYAASEAKIEGKRKLPDGPVQNEILELVGSINTIMTEINTGYAILKSVAINNADYSDLISDREAFDRLHGKITQEAAGINNEILAKQVAHFLQMIKGSSHVIKPSTKYAGGYDIIWIGKPCAPAASPLLGSKHPLSKQKPLTNLSAYEYNLSNRLAVDAINKAEIMSKLLTGGAGLDITQAHVRKYFMLPLSFDFTQFNNWTFSKDVVGASIPLFPQSLVKSNISMGLQTRLGKYYSIVLAYNPSTTVTDSALRQKNSGGIIDNSSATSRETLALEPNFSMSLALHLPKEFVAYITQTPVSQKPSLSSLNTWVNIWKGFMFRVFNKKKTKGEDKTLNRSRLLPRYILKSSLLRSILEKRKEFNMSIEEGCTDPNTSIFVANDGSLNYMIGTSQSSTTNAEEYEKILDSVIELCAEMNMPVDFSTGSAIDTVYSVEPNNEQKLAALSNLRTPLFQNAGKLLGYSWDFNTALYVDPSNPAKLTSANLSGACRPDDLAIADYLRKPFAECMRLMMPTCKAQLADGSPVALASHWGADTNQPDIFLNQIPMFKHIFNMYELLVTQGKAPDFKALVDKAAKNLGITSLDDAKVKDYENNIYHTFLTPDLKEIPGGKGIDNCVKVHTVMTAALKEAAAGYGTLHYQQLLKVNPSDPESAKVDSPRYFNVSPSAKIDDKGKIIENDFVCSADKFKNVYTYLGGQVFLVMLSELRKNISKFLYKVEFDENSLPYALGEGGEKVLPSYAIISRQIAPFIQMCTKYIPESEEIFEKAKELEESNTRDSSITISDIKIPGSIRSAELFPHQVKAHQTLRKLPRFAAIDVSPGGGKTIMLLVDAMCCIRECMERKPKVHIKPLIIAPTGLVKNWVEDLTKVAGKNWNIIPINAQILERWGVESLRKLIQDAPINTIVVCGLSILNRAGRYKLAFGNHVEECSSTIDLIKSLNFNYIAIDEAHKVKNAKSLVHQMVKRLCTASWVKYLRLASGTLISNEVKDIVGEASMFSSQIFRTVEEYTNEKTLLLGDKELNIRDRNYHQITRDKLSKHAALISIKRKEWAFMLPIPVESFHHPDIEFDRMMDDEGQPKQKLQDMMKKDSSITNEYIYLCRMHRAAYEALVEEMAKAFREALKKKKNTEDDEEDDDDEETSKDDVESLMDGPIGKYWMQRADRFLMDPLGDPMAKLTMDDETIVNLSSDAKENWEKIIDAFQLMRESNYVPRKVKIVIDLIRNHFEVANKQWKADGKYYELESDVYFEGKHYIARKRDLDSTEHKRVINKTPPLKAPESWKPEEVGKVLIFCRYNKSVEAILDYMPRDLRKKTVTYYGWMDATEKNNNIEKFKTDPNIQILLANEEGIKEGHNLQCASRLIRVELPWTPGDLEQAQSRIFRPDPKGYQDGEMDRSVIYLDIVTSDRTLEMNKLGRLYSKVIGNCKYEEADNPLYADVQIVDDSSLRLRIGKNEVQTFLSFSDNLAPKSKINEDTGEYEYSLEERLTTHMGAWSHYVGIRDTEYLRMKKEAMENGTDRLVPIPQSDVPKDFKMVKMHNVPYVANQHIDLLDHDDMKLGLVKFSDFITNPHNAKYLAAAQSGTKELTKSMKGMPVHTDFGYGTIVGFTPKRNSKASLSGSDDDDVDIDVIDYDLRVNKVRIKMAGTGEEVSVPTTIAYIGTNVSSKHMRIFHSVDSGFEIPKIEKTEKEQISIDDSLDISVDEITSLYNSITKKINARTHAKGYRPPRQKGKIYAIQPVVYNGFLAIEADTGDREPEDILLEEYDFLDVPHYAYVRIDNRHNFDAFVKFLLNTCGYSLDKNSVERLKVVTRAFDQNTKMFRIELQSFSELPRFHTWNTQTAKGKMIKVFPFVQYKHKIADKLRERNLPTSGAEILYLAVNLYRNPTFERYVSHRIPGSAPIVQIAECPRQEICFVHNKAEAMKVMGTLVESNKFGLTEKDFKVFAETLRKLHISSAGGKHD